MIIDCHGHYTTAPKALEAWRNRQIAGIKDPAAMPKVAELKISDDELRESIETNQLRLMKERGCDLTIFSPARQLHGPSHRRLRRELDLGRDLQRALLPRLEALPRQFHRRGDAAAEPRRRSEDLHSRARKMREGLRLRRDQSQSRSVRRPLDEPAADRPLVVPDLREDGRMGHPGDGACLDELQRLLPHHRRPLHQRRHHRGDAVHPGRPVQGFSDAALRRAARRRRRALPLGPLSRARAGAQEAAAQRSIC